MSFYFCLLIIVLLYFYFSYTVDYVSKEDFGIQKDTNNE